ncbi:MAG TPA: 6-phosphogluconate dehydrogenase, partial [Elusimicrobia bacterium]|nr:6-phosphogluconate dehydrogenase [Elusimicrobiota bacterium]
MKLAMVGLGRMGFNMTLRLLKGGHRVVACNRSPEPVRRAVKAGALGAATLEEAVSKLAKPRVVWLMLPAGAPVQAAVLTLSNLLEPGDVVVDGGNSRFSDAAGHRLEFSKRGVAFLDAGVSGGVWGLKNGYCLMVGGEPKAFRKIEPALRTLAPKDGYALVGPSGAGHYSKMVHNGI